MGDGNEAAYFVAIAEIVLALALFFAGATSLYETAWRRRLHEKLSNAQAAEERTGELYRKVAYLASEVGRRDRWIARCVAMYPVEAMKVNASLQTSQEEANNDPIHQQDQEGEVGQPA